VPWAIVSASIVLHGAACGAGSAAPEVARSLAPAPDASPAPPPGGVRTPVVSPAPAPAAAAEDGMLVVARLYGAQSVTGRRTVKVVGAGRLFHTREGGDSFVD
jgi:hypothetical protein